MIWLWYLILWIVLLTGLAVTVLGLPGIWLMIAAAGFYAWYTGWEHVSVWTLFILVAIGILAEIVEFIAGAAGAKKAGGSTRSAWGALAGGFVGAILGTAIPVPVLGTIIGACAGAFAGGWLAEYSVEQHHERSLRVGWASAQGRFWGIVSKLAFGVIILLIAAFAAFPAFMIAPAAPLNAPPPTTLPSTQPDA